MSRHVGAADLSMQSVSPILIAACAQKEPPGSFSYFSYRPARRDVVRK
ncbi:MAG TPA: hypothetical protein VIJ91_05725 [Candidatus Dormibacteraeota bacterium]